MADFTNLASAFLGAFVSLASIFQTGFSSPSPTRTTITAAATITSGTMFVFFGTLALFGYRGHARNVNLIKERRYQT